MGEFIKMCAGLGLFTLYAFVTCAPGLLGYHFLKHTTIDKPFDSSAAAKGILIAYGIGLIIFVWSAVYFLIIKG